MELYQAEWCPHSRRVRQRCTELGVSFTARQVPADRRDREEMRRKTGTDEIPALVLDGGTVVTGGPDPIIAHLDRSFSERSDAREHRDRLESEQRTEQPSLAAGRVVHEVMTPDPVTLDPTASLRDAARAMREHDVGAIVVTTERGIRGIVTDRDLVVRGVADTRDPEEVWLTEIVSVDAAAVAPDQPVQDAAHDTRRPAAPRSRSAVVGLPSHRADADCGSGRSGGAARG